MMKKGEDCKLGVYVFLGGLEFTTMARYKNRILCLAALREIEYFTPDAKLMGTQKNLTRYVYIKKVIIENTKILRALL